MTSCGDRPVRFISRIDCCGKIGAIPLPAAFIAATCPGVARPMRSPKPKLGCKPRTENRSILITKTSSQSNGKKASHRVHRGHGEMHAEMPLKSMHCHSRFGTCRLMLLGDLCGLCGL